MNMEKVKEVFSNAEFVKSLVEMKSAAEVQAALQEKGLELTEQDIFAIRELVTKVESGELSTEQLAVLAQQLEDGELSEEVLEQVAGGVAVTTVIGVIGIVGCIIGLGFSVDNLLVSITGRRW